MIGKIEGYNLIPLPNDILVYNMEKGYRRSKNSGLLFLDDSSFRIENIKHRWCQVYKVGSNIDFVKEGEWILVEHGRWTVGFKFVDKNLGEIYVQKIDKEAILLVANEYLENVERLEKLL
ncbi:MAG: hypothetical protein QXF12_04320 [Candidatus Aenigmatarchaeota archaeon]